MENVGFKTIVTPHVDGDSPEWYDPYWSPKTAAVYIAGKPGFVADINVLSSARSAAGNDLESFYSIASRSANFIQEEGSMFARDNINLNDDAGIPENSVKRSFVGFQQGHKTFQNSMRPQTTVESVPAQSDCPPPSIQVDFIVKEAKFKLRCFYHEVVVSEPYLILIFNANSIGFPKFFPEPGSVLYVNIPKLGIKDLILISTGIEFIHNNYEYCILADYTSVQTATKESNTSSQQVELEKNTNQIEE